MQHTRHGYWLEEAGGVEPAAPLAGERRADVVVIGGGYTGMWAAWQLKALEPNARVVLLEAELCGHGPSGRNGGFCNAMWFSLPNMRERWGDTAALAVARAAQAAVDGVGAFCEEQGVDAWFRRGGYLQVSTAPAQDGAWAEAVAACRELAGGSSAGAAPPHGEPEPAQPLTAAEVAARCASPAFRAGAFYPGAATVQPARLALGLRERLLAVGVEIFERSPVMLLENRVGEVVARTAAVSIPHDGDAVRSVGGGPVRRVDGGGPVRVSGGGGAVRAKTVVVAVGGAARAPHGPLRDALTVSSSHIVLTEPVPDLLEEIGWTGGECITDARAMLHYFRTTPDGRIAFGWGGGRIAPGARLGGRAEIDPAIVARAASRLCDYFPLLAEAGSKRPGGQGPGSANHGGNGPAARGHGPVRITHGWGGPIDISPTHIPVVVPLPGGNAFAAAGYTGNGVGPSYMVGRALASLALDRRDDHSRLAFVDPSPQRVPPEPLHWLGGAAIRRALIAKEEAEAAGRRPKLASSLISRIPDLIGFHIGR